MLTYADVCCAGALADKGDIDILHLTLAGLVVDALVGAAYGVLSAAQVLSLLALLVQKYQY